MKVFTELSLGSTSFMILKQIVKADVRLKEQYYFVQTLQKMSFILHCGLQQSRKQAFQLLCFWNKE